MFSAAIPRVRERLNPCLLHTLKSLGGHGRCCPCQQPLLRLTRVLWLTYWDWVATYSSHPFSGWCNSALYFPCNSSITRRLSQLVCDTGYTPHVRSKLNSFLGFSFTKKQINNETINSQSSAKPIFSVYYNTKPIHLCQDSHPGICFPPLMTFSCLPLPLGLPLLAGAMAWGRLHPGHC